MVGGGAGNGRIPSSSLDRRASASEHTRPPDPLPSQRQPPLRVATRRRWSSFVTTVVRPAGSGLWGLWALWALGDRIGRGEKCIGPKIIAKIICKWTSVINVNFPLLVDDYRYSMKPQSYSGQALLVQGRMMPTLYKSCQSGAGTAPMLRTLCEGFNCCWKVFGGTCCLSSNVRDKCFITSGRGSARLSL